MSANVSNLVRLVVAGADYGGWKSVRISAGIDRQARDFDLSITDKWPGQATLPRRVKPGDVVQVYIGADLVLTGYIDATPIDYDGHQFTIAVQGRSKTADLVDACPVQASRAVAAASGQVAGSWGDVKGPDGKTTGVHVAPPPRSAGGQWRGLKLEVIAAALASPYGISVRSETDTGAVIPDHQIQQGETVFESISRMMLLRHVLSTDNEYGDLVIIEPGSKGRAVTAIELGKNILTGSAPLDYRGVFSEYICKGQRAGNDDEYGTTVTEQSASTTDARATRRRVLVIRQSGQADEGTCQDRVDYEKAHRAAKALETKYTVAGWRQDDGRLWLPNMLVQVRDSLVGFNAEMLIAECSWIMDDKGLRTELRVGPVDGYRTKAGKLKAAKRQKGGGAEWSDVKAD
jgi:prophage tail gpP-like protein